MATPFNMRFGGVNLTSGAAGNSAEIPPETPFRLLVSGNYRGNRQQAPPLTQRKPLVIDRDNFDDVMAKMAPSITLPNPAGGAELTIAFRQLDDFEPDRLFKHLTVFEDLATLQAQVRKPATFAKAAATIREWTKLPEPAPVALPAPVAAKQEVTAVDLMDQVLAESRGQLAETWPRDDWQRFLDSIVAPHVVAKTDPRQAEYEM